MQAAVKQMETMTNRYAAAIEASKRVRWEIDRDVIRGRKFDLARNFLPDSLSKAAQLTFLRPGELRFLYTDKLDELAPTLVQLQILVVSTRAAGNAEQARQTCEDARERVLEGEEMGALVDEFGASLRDTHGLLQYAPAAMIPDPGLRAFAQRAEIGELSTVEPLVDPRTGQRDPELGFQLVRLADRRESPPLLFDDQRVQHTLRQVSNDSQRERILERERARLRRESYSWVNPLFAPPPAPPVTGATGAKPGS